MNWAADADDVSHRITDAYSVTQPVVDGDDVRSWTVGIEGKRVCCVIVADHSNPVTSENAPATMLCGGSEAPKN